MNDGKTIYDCGCSHLKVKLGKCDLYDANGNPRVDAPEENKLCRSAVLDMAFQFGARAHEAQLAANKLREDDASSYVEHEAIATTWNHACALLSELAGGEPSEVEPLHPIIVGEMLWSFMNERRCALITKDVHENGLSPENKTELAGLEAVLDARCALITALERLTPKGLDALTTAFADAVCNRQTPLDIETRRMLVDAIQDLSRKNLLGRLTYAEEALLARCINRLERDPMRESFVPNAPANECSDAERTQYELTIEQQQSKIADLTASVEQMENANLRTATYIEELLTHKEAMRNKIAELQARIDELTTVPVVDGQTPGQLAKTTFMRATYNTHESEGVDRWALVASEVLRVFGNGAVVLQKVKDQLKTIPAFGCPHTEYHNAFLVNDVVRIIDDELAALTSAKSPATP